MPTAILRRTSLSAPGLIKGKNKETQTVIDFKQIHKFYSQPQPLLLVGKKVCRYTAQLVLLGLYNLSFWRKQSRAAHERETVQQQYILRARINCPCRL